MQRFYSDSVGGLATASDGKGNVFIAVSQSVGGPAPMGVAFIEKHDSKGNDVWASGADPKMYGTPLPLTIATDGDGLYAGGFTAQVIRGGTEAYLARYDVSGNETWRIKFGTDGDDRVCSVAVQSGFVYAAGDSTPPRGSEAAETPRSFLREFDKGGVEIWARSLAQGQVPEGEGIAANADGIYVIVDLSRVPSSELIPGTTTNRYLNEAVLHKYDADGNAIWTRKLPKSAGYPYSLAVGPGRVYVAGYSSDASPGQNAPGGYLLAFNAEGDELWTCNVGTSPAYSVATGSIGVYVGLSGAVPGWKSQGGTDAILRAIDFDGKELWTYQFGTERDDHSVAISVDATGIFVAAHASGGPRAPSGGIYISECFIAKLSRDGMF